MHKLIYAVITFLILATQAHAGTYAQVFQSLLTQQRASGVVLSGGKAYFYSPGTENLATIYTSRTKATPAANPATLSADGTVAVYGDGQYDVKITTSSGVQKFLWSGVSLVDASNLDSTTTAFRNYTAIDRLKGNDARIATIYDVGSYSSLPAAVTAIGSTKATLRYSTDISLADNLTIPANIELQPYNGPVITIASGKTLTINGPLNMVSGTFAGDGNVAVNGAANLGLYHVFTNTGTVTITSGTAYAHWFGGAPASVGTLTDSYAAITKAIAAVSPRGTVRLTAGVWLTSDTTAITDTQADSKQIEIVGDGDKSTFLFHTGAQTTGAVKISGNAVWQAAGSFYVSIGGASSIRDISIGSRSGPAVNLSNTDRTVLDRVKFFSAGTTYPFLLLAGTVEGRYLTLDDWGNEIMPPSIAAIITAAGGAVTPYNWAKIVNGVYDDGSNGSALTTTQENFFIGCRAQALHTRETIYIERNAGSIDEVNRIHFIGGKLTGSIGATNYPIIYNNGGTQVYVTDTFFETVNTGGTKSVIVMDNQNGDSEMTITNSHDKTSTIDLGAPSGGPYSTTPGSGKISINVSNSRFYKLLNNYGSPHTDDLVLNNVGWNVAPTLGVHPPNFTVWGNYVINGDGTRTMLTNQTTSQLMMVGSDTATTRILQTAATGVTVWKQLQFGDTIAAAAASNGSFFVDTADSKLKFKGTSGTVTILANP